MYLISRKIWSTDYLTFLHFSSSSDSDSESSEKSSEDEKRKKKKKKKEKKKKSKKAKKSKEKPEKSEKVGKDHPLATVTNINPEEIPDVPSNRWDLISRDFSKKFEKNMLTFVSGAYLIL